MLLFDAGGVGVNSCTLQSAIALRCAVFDLLATGLCFGVAFGASVVLRSTSAYDLIALRAVRYLQSGLLRLARPRGFPL